jgi:hypothetical protein
MTIGSNLTLKRIVMRIIMNSSEERRWKKRRKKNGGWRNIIVEDATLIGGMIRTMTEELLESLSRLVFLNGILKSCSGAIL